MSTRTVAAAVAASTMLTVAILGAGPASATRTATGPTARPASSVTMAHDPVTAAAPPALAAERTVGAVTAALAAAALTPAQAVVRARSEAAANGINTHLSVIDRNTGAILAQSDAGTQVASESIMKLMLASYYMVLVGGYQNQSQSVRDQLSFMIRYSDDATANSYFSSAAIPTIAARYGMSSTINATDRTGHWGAARITAHDMTTFLYRMARDPEVGPWLIPVMAQVAPVGSDGFNQHFGMNSLSGVHGSKQGWGDDEFWSSANQVINSVGYTDRYYVAILQNSDSYPDPARATSTYAASNIAASRRAVSAPPPPPPAPPKNGDFVAAPGSSAVYRLAGGAPIYVSSWAAFGGIAPVRRLTTSQWLALRAKPADGTFVVASGSGAVYRFAGGAPIYVSNWATFGGVKTTIRIDAAAVAHSGQSGVWSHVGYRPVDGTYLLATGSNQVFRVVAGTPTYVASWAHFGGAKRSVVVDGTAIVRAGQPGVWVHLRGILPEGTFIRSTSGQVYRIAGSAPVYVSSWNVFSGVHATQLVDATAVADAGRPGPYAHLAGRPRNGTFLTVTGSNIVYRMAGGAPLYLASWSIFGGVQPTVTVDPAAVAHGGQGGVWEHLLFYPVDGTFLAGKPGNRVYRTSNGRAVYVPSWKPYGGPQRSIPITALTIARAGTGGFYNHLKK